MSADPEAPRVLLDLRGIEPTPDRLLDVVRASAQPQVREVVVRWGDRFPWALDDAVRARDAFPEELVAAVGRAVDGAGLRLVARLESVLPRGYASRPGYRHLVRAARDRDPQWDRALVKLARDLLEDLMGLMPELAGVELAPTAPEGAAGSRGGATPGIAVTPAGAATPGFAAALREAAADLGLIFREASPGSDAGPAGERLSPGWGITDREAWMSSLEERLARAAHPASCDRAIPTAHDRLRAWRARGWELAARLHELVIAAGREPAAGDTSLVDAMRELAGHLRRESELRRELDGLYEGLAVEGSAIAIVRRTGAPLREQYGALSARVAAIRAVR